MISTQRSVVKQLRGVFATGAVMAMAVSICLAATFTNFSTTTNPNGANKVCTLTPGSDAGQGATLTIPNGATVTAYGADGKALSPQPCLVINPSINVPGASITIRLCDGGEFPVGTKFTISRIDQSSGTATPQSTWSAP